MVGAGAVIISTWMRGPWRPLSTTVVSLIVLVMLFPGVNGTVVMDPSIVTIDEDGNTGWYSSIAIDSKDKAHVSYYNWDDLMYATDQSGSWELQAIDREGSTGWFSSIAIDSNDKVHISYYAEEDYYDLRYATNSNGVWEVQTIDSEGDVGHDTSIAVDSRGGVHISYQDWTNQDLKYATNSGGQWTNRTIDRDGDLGDGAIAVDSQGGVHIVYSDHTRHLLKYATDQGGKWTTSVIYGSEAVVGDSIAFDADGALHIGFIDEAGQDLMYATNKGGKWSIETVDTELDYRGGAVALDDEGNVHISYSAYTDQDIRYATNKGGKWSIETVDTEGEMMGAAIAVDSNGVVHLTYQNAMVRDLMGATFLPHLPTVPGRPTGLTAMPGNGQVQLSWFVPDDDGGSPVTTYRLSWSVNASTSFQFILTNGTNYLHDGLVNGTRYNYKISAGNNIGQGADSPIVSATPESTLLVTSPPRSLTAVVGSDGISVSWAAPEDPGGREIIGYRVFRDTSPNVLRLVTTTTETSYLDPSMEVGVRVYYQISALNEAGEGMRSEVVSATFVEGPAPPTYLTAEIVERGVSLAWEPPIEDGGLDVLSYNLLRGTDPNSLAPLATMAGTEYLDVNVTNGATYYYAIEAVNAVGKGDRSSWLNVTVPLAVPSAPLDLRAQVVNGEVALTWNTSTSDGGSPILGYSIFRGTDLDHMAYLGSVTGTSFVDQGVETGVVYYYAVTAVNSVGRSAPAGAVDVVVSPQTLLDPGLAVLVTGGLAVLGIGAVSTVIVLRRRRSP
jgi:fibronectin type 3 domain-containing protein